MSSGLERLLAGETNVSDLMAYFTENDPTPWKDLIGSTPGQVLRESGAGTRKRADLILRDADGGVVGAVEVKLGHDLGADQVQWYEGAFGEGVPLILASLDQTDSALENVGERWTHIPLADLMGRWLSSSHAEVATFAAAIHRVLSVWSDTLSAVTGADGRDLAEPLSRIRDPFLARILTRTLRTSLESDGGVAAFAGTTSGGGNAILQARAPLPGDLEAQSVIAEIRWSPAKDVMDFRFGLDFGESNRASRSAIWERARQMDDAIRADTFQEHLARIDPSRAALITRKKASGRPAAKGDWNVIVERGFDRGDAKTFNPGFYRDGDTRFEASARIDTSRASGADVVALLGHALRYLASGDGRSQ